MLKKQEMKRQNAEPIKDGDLELSVDGDEGFMKGDLPPEKEEAAFYLEVRRQLTSFLTQSGWPE